MKALVTITRRAQPSARLSLAATPRRRPATVRFPARADDAPARSDRWLAPSRSADVGQRAERQSVDDDRRVSRQSGETRRAPSRACRARERKAVAEIDESRPASRAREARRRCAGHRRSRRSGSSRSPGAAKTTRSHHKGASYQARATCDSEMVTRMALSSRPSRPRPPDRAAAARPSKHAWSGIRSSC